ncbi:MAG: serine/threonine protein kinase [Deltaproteobacteria bacterium]|nr:serine/threonine protein kinase [Deltaproteobacteria bacterium]
MSTNTGPTPHSQPQPLKRPVEFGNYLLTERLAVGGMAEIFKARAPGPLGFEKTVVVKRMLTHLARDKAFVDMFIDEARLMGRISHPRIVQVFDFGEIKGHYFITMEYVEGTDGLTLLQRCAISRRRPPSAIAVQIVAEVLDALDYVHTLEDSTGTPLHVVHRDISPSNIFISERGDVKLGDFGIAQSLARRAVTQAGVLKGKYGYMSPEQVAGRDVDHRRDVFAAGVVLAELLMVRRLFMAENELDVLLQIRDAKLDRLERYGEHIPPALRNILDAALARNPDLRYQTAATFLQALHHYLHSEQRIVNNAAVRRFLHRIAPQRDEVLDQPGTPTKVVGVQTNVEMSSLPRELGKKRRIQLAPPLAAAGSGHTREENKLPTEDALAALPELERYSTSNITAGTLEVPKAEEIPPAPDPKQAISARNSGVVDQLNPNAEGMLEETNPFCLLFQLGIHEQTGLLVLQTGDISKRLYVVDGHPEVVISNQTTELLGQFLVNEEVISEGELSMALAMLPHFDGRLGDTLVGLDLISAMEVARQLTILERIKVLEIFTWTEGYFAFYRGMRSQEESAPLGLTTFELLGEAASALPDERLAARLDPLMKTLMRRTDPPPVPPEAFQLGELPRRIYSALRETRSLLEHLAKIDASDMSETQQVLMLLLETGFIQLGDEGEGIEPVCKPLAGLKASL